VLAISIMKCWTSSTWAATRRIADDVVRLARERFDLALGVGPGRLSGHVFRIGHHADAREHELVV